MEHIAAHQLPAPEPRHRGPAIKDKPERKDRLPTVGEYFENDKGDRFILRQKLGDGAMGHVFLSIFGGRFVAYLVFCSFQIAATLKEVRHANYSTQNLCGFLKTTTSYHGFIMPFEALCVHLK